MKFTIFGITISSARRIRRKLEEGKRKGHDETMPKIYGYVLGVYDSRIFGICIYRNAA